MQRVKRMNQSKKHKRKERFVFRQTSEGALVQKVVLILVNDGLLERSFCVLCTNVKKYNKK